MLTALAVAVIGATASLGALLAQVTGGSALDAAPYVQAGGTVSAVGALVYTVRQLVNGGLVARPVAQIQTELAALVQASFQREEKYATILADAAKREDALALTLDRTAQQLGRALAELERRGAP